MALLAMAVSLAACGDSSATNTAGTTGTESGDTLVVDERGESTIYSSITADVGGLDPFISISSGLQYGVYEALVNYGTDGYEPGVAESWEIAEDGMSITFHLSPDLVTHGGYPVTASDVLWLVSKHLEGNYSRFAKVFDVENSEVIDDQTVKMALSNKYIRFDLDSVAHMMITSQEQYEASPDGFYNDGLGGTGPYKVVSYTEGVELVLTKFENYVGAYHEQNVDNIVVKVISEVSQRLIELEADSIDIMVDPNSSDIEYITSLSGVSILNELGTKNACLVFNVTADSPIADPLVRKAIGAAIDNVLIAEQVFSGLKLPAYSVISPVAAEYDSSLEDTTGTYMSYDVDLAKSLLAEAGYSDGFELEIAYDGRIATNERLGQIIQGELKEIGIIVTLTPYDTTSYSTLTNGTEGWECGLSEYKVQDSVVFTFYNKCNENKSSWGGWFIQDFQDMLDEVVYTFDEATIQEMVDIYMDECPQYTISYNLKQFAVRDGIDNFFTTGDNYMWPGDWTYNADADWLYD
ncbi:MAG: ABC transporter substrate-binding protein [Oscillospiraceae bacterium]|nr:ABC transporter substrate-binding protein [Oscillospiraceae bacterium]